MNRAPLQLFLLALVVGLAFCLPFIAFAGDATKKDRQSEEWLETKNKLQELVKGEKCEEYWDLLWPWAKKGNLEARVDLLTLMAPPPHGTTVIAPGNSGDLVSRIRDILVMAVHSDGYKSEAAYTRDYRELAYELYINEGFQEIPEGRRFLECVKSGSGNCAEIAVKGKLVPSFDEYASQLDVLARSGMKSTCISASITK
jgi:hypothetical protein